MIYLASDHAGFFLKERLKEFFNEQKISYLDIGPSSYEESDDYPDYIVPAARKVAESAENKGIVIGGSGQGEAIAANKIRGVRCALYYGHNRQMIALSKEHNNANMLSLGARFLTEQEAKEAVLLWLSVPFSNQERHLRRIRKISGLEEKVK